MGTGCVFDPVRNIILRPNFCPDWWGPSAIVTFHSFFQEKKIECHFVSKILKFQGGFHKKPRHTPLHVPSSHWHWVPRHVGAPRHHSMRIQTRLAPYLHARAKF